MSELGNIERLLEAVAKRCNRLLVVKILVQVLTFVGFGVALSSLVWVFRGHAVPWWVWGVGLVAMGSVVGLMLVQRWMDRRGAASFGDEHFKLKDGLSTLLYLEGKKEGVASEELQRRWVAERVEGCDAATIQSKMSRRWYGGALLGVVSALSLAFVPASPEVLAAQQEERETRERVSDAKEQLEELIDELDNELASEDDEESVDLDEFRELVKEIEETGDRAEASRQFAKIEQKVREAERKFDQRADEKTLEMAGKELAKAEETEPRQLGKKLVAKDWKEAEEMMKKLEAEKFDLKELKRDPKKLSEVRKDLAKMRAVTKRLAAAGKKRKLDGQSGQKQKGAGNLKQQAGKQGKDGKMAKAGQNAQREAPDNNDKSLEDLMVEVDEAAEEMEDMLKEMEMDPNQEPSESECESCQQCQGKCQGAMGKLRKKMRKMAGRKKAKSKLSQLRKGLSKAQGMCQGKCQSLGSGAQPSGKPGGKKPGKGSVKSNRQERDDSQKNGSLANLKGQHGDGPSMSSVEEAESGSGVSSRRGTGKKRDFARQAESFVQRDDIPESLKLGVRNYFENLETADSKVPEVEE